MSGTVVAIGVFDGVHRGHHALVNEARLRAQVLGASVVAVTFDPHPAAVLAPERSPLLLTTLAQRIELLHEAGCDSVQVQEFTSQFAHKSPEQFVDEVLVPLEPKAIIVGENFRFGYRASGDVRTLADLGETRGFEVQVAALRTEELMVVSSTRIRSLVVAGQVGQAADLLGRPHRLDGTVVHGDKRGREIGYPTANLQWAAEYAVPEDGVYAGRLILRPGIDEQVFSAAVSVGTNPHFGGVTRRVETYVMDAPEDFDIYGESVGVEFIERIRGQVALESLEELLTLMAADVAYARQALAER
ncbi:MAG: bifunctional riboflavin kinase/FAD synthetase [Actinomycetes bacterium]